MKVWTRRGAAILGRAGPIPCRHSWTNPLAKSPTLAARFHSRSRSINPTARDTRANSLFVFYPIYKRSMRHAPTFCPTLCIGMRYVKDSTIEAHPLSTQLLDRKISKRGVAGCSIFADGWKLDVYSMLMHYV